MDRPIPRPGEFYQHFKGNMYQILTIAKDSETQEKIVVYQALYGKYDTWVRPLSQFLSPVDKNKYPTVTEVWRFTKVELKEEASTDILSGNLPDNAPDDTRNIITHPVPDNKQSKEKTATELFLLFLDTDNCKEKLELLSSLRGKADRIMVDSMAASMDLILPGKTIEDDLDLIADHIRTRARFEGSRHIN